MSTATLSVLNLVAWCIVLVASLVGLALKDVRLYGATLCAALVVLVLMLVHH